MGATWKIDLSMKIVIEKSKYNSVGWSQLKRENQINMSRNKKDFESFIISRYIVTKSFFPLFLTLKQPLYSDTKTNYTNKNLNRQIVRFAIIINST